jgi:hypothetical protein
MNDNEEKDPLIKKLGKSVVKTSGEIVKGAVVGAIKEVATEKAKDGLKKAASHVSNQMNPATALDEQDKQKDSPAMRKLLEKKDELENQVKKKIIKEVVKKSLK